MKRAMVPTLLLVAGLIAMAVGVAVLLMPTQFFAMNGVMLSEDASLMSEIRAPGGLLLASGLAIALGAFDARMTKLGLALSSMLFLSYGVSRLWSFAIDGMPATALLQATGLELLIGMASLVAWLRQGRAQTQRDALA